MVERDLVRTGISGLDDILTGGIPRGNVILLEGAVGTGKTTTGVEFIYRGISQYDEPGLIVLFEVSPEKLVRDAAGLGWDLASFERENRLRIIFTTRAVFRQELQQADSLLLDEAANMGARRIFVDGVAGVVTGTPGQEPREAFHVLVEGLQRENLTAMLALEASVFDGGGPVSLPEESIADTVIRLRMEDSARTTVRSVEIVKNALEATRMMLDSLGAHVLVARNGRDALDVLRANTTDLVLCDLRMPEMDGFEFLHEHSRSEGHDRTPVVAMTGFVTQADRDRTHAAGFAGHLKKPFDDVGLVSVVDAALQPRGAVSVEPAKRAVGKASGMSAP